MSIVSNPNFSNLGNHKKDSTTEMLAEINYTDNLDKLP